MNNRKTVYILLFAAFTGCIGTDILEIEIVPRRVEITLAVDSLRVGENFQFIADYFDSTGSQMAANITWRSSDESVISVDEQGLAAAHMEGSAIIYAAVNEIQDSIPVVAGDQTSVMVTERSGSFQGLSSYRVEGQFTLRPIMDMGQQLELVFDENFRTSNGPGLYVYLSNSGTSVSGGLNLGKLESNSGAQRYEVPPEVNLNTYDFAVIYCQPFGVSFGFGEFN